MTLYYRDEDCALWHGDALAELRGLPDAAADCCVTSPPYWALRDYGEPGQIGAEAHPAEYVGRLVAVCAEVRRVLAPAGTLWLNLGDTYAACGNGGGGGFVRDRRAWHGAQARTGWRGAPKGFQRGDLLGIPWRVALALQEAGWVLRCDVIWSKANGMPTAPTKRPERTHEYLFLLTRHHSDYYYDEAAVREPAVGGGTRRLRSVWRLPVPRGGLGHHTAVYSEALVRPCVQAGCPPGGTVLDPFVGTGTTCRVAKDLGRAAIGIDISAASLALARDRMQQEVLNYG